MSVLIMKVDALGDIHYSRLHTIRPAYSQAYRYNHDDIDFEENRKTRNKPIIQGIVRDLRKMEAEASNGFTRKILANQLKTIEKRKIQICSRLSEGDFYPNERKHIIEATSRMINRRYAPFLKPNSSN